MNYRREDQLNAKMGERGRCESKLQTIKDERAKLLAKSQVIWGDFISSNLLQECDSL